ncbi:MAG TPA: metallophosphoesterase family protein [Polyangiaceae bacterium]|nr:metallophosphoesterase family protein [Polyangiaceae bacterium]
MSLGKSTTLMGHLVHVGVISDTHGLLRPEALEALRGVDHIVHAGDVGEPEVLSALGAIAPLTAVRGNNDKGPWAKGLPESAAVEVGGAWFYVLHDRNELDLDPAAAGFAAVITGHTHRPAIEVRKGVLYLNPGSAGPRRFRLPIALAKVEVSNAGVRPELITLAP